jgi:hypothetical protein
MVQNVKKNHQKPGFWVQKFGFFCFRRAFSVLSSDFRTLLMVCGGFRPHFYPRYACSLTFKEITGAFVLLFLSEAKKNGARNPEGTGFVLDSDCLHMATHLCASSQTSSIRLCRIPGGTTRRSQREGNRTCSI